MYQVEIGTYPNYRQNNYIENNFGKVSNDNTDFFDDFDIFGQNDDNQFYENNFLCISEGNQADFLNDEIDGNFYLEPNITNDDFQSEHENDDNDEEKQEQNFNMKTADSQNREINNDNIKSFYSTIEPIQRSKQFQRRKMNLELSEEAKKFKEKYYQIFTSKKKISKQHVKKIHDILQNHFCFRRMNREEYRSINLYFKDYAFHREPIINFLIKNKKYIIEQIPDLRNL